MKILFTGGGTGGHVYPIVAVVRALKAISKGRYPLKLFYLGPKDNFCRVVLAREGVKVKTITAGRSADTWTRWLFSKISSISCSRCRSARSRLSFR